MPKTSTLTRNSEQRAKIQRQLAQIYTPGVPITDPKLFSGREALLEALRLELAVAGRNFVLYGERGVGKTSFCSVLLYNHRFERHNCSKEDDFITIFLNILSRRGEQFTDAEQEVLAKAGYKIGGDKLLVTVEGGIEGKTKEVPVALRRLDLNFVLNKLRKLQREIQCIVLDEFQNIESRAVQTAIIEVVKGLSDENIPINLVIVGIADADTELLTSPEYPQYKGRHFVAARIPRMIRRELADIIEKREHLFGIKFGSAEIGRIAEIAAGYPQYAHTLALYACVAWLAENFAAAFKSWASRIPLLDVFFKPVAVESINWNVTSRQLSTAVKQLIRQFEIDHPDVGRKVKTALGSEHQKAIHALVGVLARSEGDDIAVNELVAVLGMTAPQVDQLIRNHLSGVVESRGGRCYRAHMSQLRPYILALEYDAAAPDALPKS